MRIRFECRGCGATVATRSIEPPAEAPCPRCGALASFAARASAGEALEHCLACGGPHMYIQKQFPRRIGLAIVLLGAGLFLFLMGLERIYLGFGVLFAVAMLDFLVYAAAPFMTVCYHCGTEFRGAPVHPRHGGYDPKIAYYTARQASERATPASALDPGKSDG